MPKIKVEAKKTAKVEIETHDLARAIAENWESHEIAQFLDSLFDEIGYEGKDGRIVEYLDRSGRRELFRAWSKGETV